MRDERLNDCFLYFVKQFAIPGMRLTLESGPSELSHSDRIPQRHDAARRHHTILTVAVEKGLYAS
jgi:hypothetical protein